MSVRKNKVSFYFIKIPLYRLLTDLFTRQRPKVHCLRRIYMYKVKTTFGYIGGASNLERLALAVPGSIAQIYLTLYGVPLHIAFHFYPPVVMI